MKLKQLFTRAVGFGIDADPRGRKFVEKLLKKQAEDILVGSTLAPYLSKRARKGKLLEVRVKEPTLSPVV